MVHGAGDDDAFGDVDLAIGVCDVYAQAQQSLLQFGIIDFADYVAQCELVDRIVRAAGTRH